MVVPWPDPFLDPTAEIEKTIAVQGFISLLQYLRIVVLQDAVALSQKYPNHPIFSLQLFRSDRFLGYGAQLLRAMDSEEDPTESNLRRFLPALADKINNVHQSLMIKSSEIQQEVLLLKQQAFAASQGINDVLSGRAPLYINVQNQAIKQNVTDPACDADAPSQHLQPNIDPSPHRSTAKMSRSLQTVSDVWREYTHGLGGSPSIEQLDLQFGNSWRQSTAERKFFSRRLKIYKAIKAKLSEGKTEDAAVEELEGMRLSRGWSLDKLQKSI